MTPNYGLQGHSTIVTGGATILGRGVVDAFVAAGARVTVVDIDADGGRTVAEQAGEAVAFVEADVTSDEDCARAVEAAISAHGHVDSLVNLACSYVDSGLDSTRAEWLASYDVNVVGGVMMLKALLGHLRERGGGAVVNITSISSKVAQTGRWLYPATKAAIVQVTRSEAMDLAGDGIRVNSVSPGWTWSKVMHELSGDDRPHVDAVAADFHLTGRVGDPDEVAQVVLFLCSDGARLMTGADVAVDGGYSAMGPERAQAAIARLAKEPTANPTSEEHL